MLLASTGAHALTQTRTVTCSASTPNPRNPDIMECANLARYALESMGRERGYRLRLQAPNAHCSDIRYSVRWLDTGVRFAKTRFLSAGQSQIVNLPRLERGHHQFMITAEGRVGGCNTGIIHSWGIVITLMGWP